MLGECINARTIAVLLSNQKPMELESESCTFLTSLVQKEFKISEKEFMTTCMMSK